MAARVALLIIVTGVFAALWSGDHPDRLAAVERPATEAISSRRAAKSQRVHNIRRMLDELSPTTDPASLPALNISIGVPLPESIAAGRYLISDQFGRTQFRIVTPEQAVENSHCRRIEIADHYSVTSGNLHWHYLKIEQFPSDALATSPKTNAAVR